MIYPLSGIRKEVATPPAFLAKAGKYLSRFFKGIPRALKTQKTYELANQMANHKLGKTMESIRRGPFEVELSPTDIKEGGWFGPHTRIYMFTPQEQKRLMRGYSVEKPMEPDKPFDSLPMYFSSKLDLTHPGVATRKQMTNSLSKQQRRLKELGGQ